MGIFFNFNLGGECAWWGVCSVGSVLGGKHRSLSELQVH